MTSGRTGHDGAQRSGLDPQVVQLRDLQGTHSFPRYVDVGPQGAREASRAVTAWRNSLAAPVDVVESIEDIVIPTATTRLRARVYRPVGTVVGEVLYFHGGGFVVGDLDTCDAHCRAIAALAGVVVTSLEYSLAPENPYPVAVRQATDALRWLCARAASSPRARVPVAVAGDSAGASLAASAVALSQGEPEVLVASQLLLYPMLDPSMSFPSIRENGDGYLIDRGTIEWFWRLYLEGCPPEDASAASPFALSLGGVAPAIVVTAGFDPFRDEGDQFAERLRVADVPTTLMSFPSLAHGFFGWGAQVASARSAVLQICAALRAGLLG